MATSVHKGWVNSIEGCLYVEMSVYIDKVSGKLA